MIINEVEMTICVLYYQAQFALKNIKQKNKEKVVPHPQVWDKGEGR